MAIVQQLKRLSISSVILTFLLLFFSIAVIAQPPKDNPGKSKTEHIQQVKDKFQTNGQQGKDKAAEAKDKVQELKSKNKPVKDKDNADVIKPGKGKDHLDASDHPGKGKQIDKNDKGKDDDDDEGSEGENDENDAGPKTDKPKTEKENNGNGYGKDKGDLTGREFGQQRAEAAKMNKETKIQELNSSISNANDKLKDAKDKIKAAREKMDKEKASGQLTDSAFKEKAQKIAAAEMLLQSLQEKMEKARQIGND